MTASFSTQALQLLHALKTLVICSLLAFTLAACGGGGGGDDSNPTDDRNPTSNQDADKDPQDNDDDDTDGNGDDDGNGGNGDDNSDTPVAKANILNLDQGETLTFNLESETQGEVITYAIASQPSNGQLTTNFPSVTYTPNPDFNGVDTFTFTVTVDGNTSEPASIQLEVALSNNTPQVTVATNQTVPEDGDLVIPLLIVDDSETLTADIVTAPTQGEAEISLTNINYTPNDNFFGADQITFEVSDGEKTTEEITIQITVTPVNDPPSGENGEHSISEYGFIEITPTITDIDSAEHILTITTPIESGTAEIREGKIFFEPADDFVGTEEISVIIDDGEDTATMTHTVNVLENTLACNDTHQIKNLSGYWNWNQSEVIALQTLINNTPLIPSSVADELLEYFDDQLLLIVAKEDYQSGASNDFNIDIAFNTDALEVDQGNHAYARVSDNRILVPLIRNIDTYLTIINSETIELNYAEVINALFDFINLPTEGQELTLEYRPTPLEEYDFCFDYEIGNPRKNSNLGFVKKIDNDGNQQVVFSGDFEGEMATFVVLFNGSMSESEFSLTGGELLSVKVGSRSLSNNEMQSAYKAIVDIDNIDNSFLRRFHPVRGTIKMALEDGSVVQGRFNIPFHDPL